MKSVEESNLLILGAIKDIRASGEVIDGKRKLEDHPRKKMENGKPEDILKDIFGKDIFK